MRCTPENERGIALLIAILTLTVIGALVTGSFFLSTLEQRTARNASSSARAFEAAEAGLSAFIGEWAPQPLAPGTTVVGPKTQVPNAPADSFQVSISPLNTELLLVRSVGTSVEGATHSLATVIRLVTVAGTLAAVPLGGHGWMHVAQ